MSHSQVADHAASLAHDDAGRKARMALLAIWQIRNENTARSFGGAMAGLFIVLILSHWLPHLFNKHFSRSRAFHRRTRAIAHIWRRSNTATIVGGVLFQPGITFLAMLYFGVNVTLTFYDNPEKAGLTILAKRFGWLSLCNLCLTMFLALKNTPLSPLAGRSFDRVNALHRCSGFVTIMFAILHSTTYIYGLSTFGVMEQVLSSPQQYAGAVACSSMLLILATAIGFVRRRQYEMFFVVHVVMAAVVLVAGLHRPDVSKQALVIIILSAAMWSADKALRLSRWIYHGAGNHCILTPLKESATRVTMYRHINARPGRMVFLWVPGVKMFQRHPFTLLSTHPATFVIQAQEGFTKTLHFAACHNPGGKFRAAIEGPYCVVPQTTVYDKVVLIAGGTGATFTMAVALEWARRCCISRHRSTLDFIWIVRSNACLEWLDVELSELRVHSGVSISLYVSSDDNSRPGGEHFPSSDLHLSQEPVDGLSPVELQSWPENDGVSIMCESPSIQQGPSPQIMESFKTGRPNLYGLIRHAITELEVDDKILVTGCGSSTLLQHVRQAVDGCRVASAPSIEVHLEQYSI